LIDITAEINDLSMFLFSGYTLEKMNTKKGVWEKVPGTIPKDAEEAVVPKLKEGEDYKFRVTADNENGPSEPLETDRAVKAKNPFGKLTEYIVYAEYTTYSMFS
jgi:hypothetical protein